MSTDTGPAWLEIPLRNRRGHVIALARVDFADALLSTYRWSLNANGYAYRTALVEGRRTTVRMNRAVVGLRVGDPREADHVNGDRLDNRRGNLRITTRGGNAQNRVFKNRSGYRGVVWHKRDKRWQAAATVGGVRHHLGLHDTAEQAADAARAFRAAHMPLANGARQT